MIGLKRNLSEEKEKILAATADPPGDGDFIWDGRDEDDRPLSKEEMRAGIKRPGGRPALDKPKKSTTIRLDADVIDFFKAHGKGWQTEINNVLQEYVRSTRA